MNNIINTHELPCQTHPSPMFLFSVSMYTSSDVISSKWQESFSKLAPDIASCIKVHVKDLTENLIRQEQDKLHKHGAMDTVPVPEQLRGGRLDYPRTISKVGLKGNSNSGLLSVQLFLLL